MSKLIQQTLPNGIRIDAEGQALTMTFLHLHHSLTRRAIMTAMLLIIGGLLLSLLLSLLFVFGAFWLLASYA